MKITMEFYAELDDQVPDADDETLRALWPVFVKEQEQADLFREFLDEVSNRFWKFSKAHGRTKVNEN